jgi:uncharacterized phiE125 gp8 family phage protein
MGLIGDIVANVVTTTEPAAEPVSLARAFTSASVDDDVAALPDVIELMSGFIVSARDRCENMLSRAFVQRTFQLRLNRFPFAIPTVYYPYYSLERMPNQLYGMIPIPYPPLVQIDSISYTDPSGADIVMDPSKYVVESGGKFQGMVTPSYGLAFPATRYAMASVRIDYTAGYSPDDSAVPQGIKSAILLLTSHWWRNREATAPPSALPAGIAMGVDALLAPYDWGFYG